MLGVRMLFSPLITCLAIVWIPTVACQRTPPLSYNSTTTDVLQYFMRTGTIRRHERPGEGNGPTKVNVSIWIQNIRALDEVNMEVIYDLYFRYKWHDPGAKFEDGPRFIRLTKNKARSMFWIPDLFFANAHQVTQHATMDENAGVKLYNTGDIFVSTKYSLTARCDMDLSFFPHDTQKCGFLIESYLYSAEDLSLGWMDQGITKPSDMYTAAFRTLDIDSRLVTEVTSTGNFECLKVEITLERVSTHYVVLVYVPSIILVVLSCMVYWLPLTALLERTLLSSLLLLAMTGILLGSQYNTPRVGYLKALDVWVVSCFVFLAVVVLEVVALHLLFGQTTRINQGDQFELMRENEGETRPNGVTLPPWLGRHNVAKKLDLTMKILYPASFVLFCAIFWAVYK